MTYHILQEETPKYGALVVVWRYISQSYIVAELACAEKCKRKIAPKIDFWRSNQGRKATTHPFDQWAYFTPAPMEEVYGMKEGR
jgi:hypothetical protein